MKLPSLRIKSVTVLALLGASSVFGQTAAPPAASGRPAAPEEEIVELSPFIVNPEDDDGYQAGNTLAGSRLNTDLNDTSASISFLTA